MRLAGSALAALLIGVTVAWAQPPVAGSPVTPPAAPAAKSDPKLDAHLENWEKTMGALTNFRFELNLKKTDAVFKKDKPYSGVVLCMKPNLAVVRMNYDGDKSGADYEAFICDGKSLYHYTGLERTITEYKLPDPKTNPVTDNLMLDFLSGMKAKDAKARFDLSLFKEDANYVYLDVKPVLGKDKEEFQQLRMALYGPNTKFAYLPAQVYMVHPNGDTELWKFTDPQTNIPVLAPKDFAFQKVPGFQMKQPPPPPAPARPGQPMLPAGAVPPGGLVRPDK
jgi:TIGR03009 family protein